METRATQGLKAPNSLEKVLANQKAVRPALQKEAVHRPMSRQIVKCPISGSVIKIGARMRGRLLPLVTPRASKLVRWDLNDLEKLRENHIFLLQV